MQIGKSQCPTGKPLTLCSKDLRVGALFKNVYMQWNPFTLWYYYYYYYLPEAVCMFIPPQCVNTERKELRTVKKKSRWMDLQAGRRYPERPQGGAE